MTPPEFRTNVTIRLTPCRSRDKGRLLWSRLDAGGRAGAVAARVRDLRAAKRMLELLRRAGRDARMLTPEQSESEQARCAAWFRAAARPALALAGDLPIPERPDVRQLYIMNLPPSLAAARADLGAAGRDCLAANAEIFASGRDLDWRLAAAAASHDPATDKAALAEVVAWIENDGCVRQYLDARSGGRRAGPCGNCGWCLGKRNGLLPPDV